MGKEILLEFTNNKQSITYEEMQKLKTMSLDCLIKVAQKQSMRTEEKKFYGVQGIKFPGNSTSTWKYLKEV